MKQAVFSSVVCSWLWPSVTELDLRGPVWILSLLAAVLSALVKWTLENGAGEGEGGKAGRECVLRAPVCVYYALIRWNLIPAVRPTVPSTTAAPFGQLSIVS